MKIPKQRGTVETLQCNVFTTMAFGIVMDSGPFRHDEAIDRSLLKRKLKKMT